jgi:hypothetical protein
MMKHLLTIGAAALLIATARANSAACAAKCTEQGHCCQGSTSACQKPSCAQGCLAAAKAASEAACNAICTASIAGNGSHCTYAVPGAGITFNMCGVCQAEPAPAWWPKAATPPNGQRLAMGDKIIFMPPCLFCMENP